MYSLFDASPVQARKTHTAAASPKSTDKARVFIRGVYQRVSWISRKKDIKGGWLWCARRPERRSSWGGSARSTTCQAGCRNWARARSQTGQAARQTATANHQAHNVSRFFSFFLFQQVASRSAVPTQCAVDTRNTELAGRDCGGTPKRKHGHMSRARSSGQETQGSSGERLAERTEHQSGAKGRDEG